MIKLSAVVITFNEEKNISRCLESLKNVADEIIVVDSLSTDSTIEIAKSYGAVIISQPFLGYVAQKRFADTLVNNEWILSIDADEELTPELQASILKVKEKPECDAYKMPRLNNYCGQWIRHCGWYPDTKTRMYNKLKGSWQGERIHEKWELFNNKTATIALRGDLNHYSFNTISEHTHQIASYSDISAREAVEKGKTVSLLKMMIVPGWSFFTSYILRLGILDGYYGYIICRLIAYGQFVKYAKTRQYTQWKKEGKQF